MDQELKDYLGAMEKRLATKQDLERVDAKIDGAVQLLINEMGNRFGEVGQRLERIELRLDRQAGLVQTGSRWIARQNDWSERSDVAQQEMQKQIHDIQERLRRLEEGNGDGAAGKKAQATCGGKAREFPGTGSTRFNSTIRR